MTFFYIFCNTFVSDVKEQLRQMTVKVTLVEQTATMKRQSQRLRRQRQNQRQHSEEKQNIQIHQHMWNLFHLIKVHLYDIWQECIKVLEFFFLLLFCPQIIIFILTERYLQLNLFFFHGHIIIMFGILDIYFFVQIKLASHIIFHSMKIVVLLQRMMQLYFSYY